MGSALDLAILTLGSFLLADKRLWSRYIDLFQLRLGILRLLLILKFHILQLLSSLLSSRLRVLQHTLSGITERPKQLLHFVGVLQQIVWQLLEFLWCEYGAIGPVRFLPESDDVSLLVPVDEIEVVPRSPVVSQRRLVVASEEVGQLIGVDVLQELLLVRAAYDLDFLPCFLVQECFHDGPHACENPGRVDDHHLTELLGVVVLCDLGAQLHEGLCALAEQRHGEARHVQDGEGVENLLL